MYRERESLHSLICKEFFPKNSSSVQMAYRLVKVNWLWLFCLLLD